MKEFSVDEQKIRDIERKIEINSREELLNDLTKTLFADSSGTVRQGGESYEDETDSEERVQKEYDSKIIKWMCDNRTSLERAVQSTPRVIKVAELFLSTFFPEFNFVGLTELHEQTVLQLVATIIKDVTEKGFDVICNK